MSNTPDPPTSLWLAPRQPVLNAVLVVEDSIESQLVVAAQLEHLGYEFEIVDNGEAALGALERSRYSIVLVDWHLPGMDGLEVIRRLRDRERRQGRPRTPVVSLTARSMPGDIEACLSAGADKHLAKPAGLAGLGSVLRRFRNESTDGDSTNLDTTEPDPSIEPDPSTGQVIDTATLDRLLADIGDADVFRTVVRTYLDQLPRRLTTLAAARQQGAQAVLSAAHSLKGTSATLGASTLTERASTFESDARLGRCGSPDALKELEQLARLTTLAMEQFIDAIGTER
jgi:CheY-like chemotaxis protein